MSAIESSRERVEDVPVANRAPMSFEVFFESERVRLHRVLFAITGSRQEAEDIAQEAFLRVWERWDRVGVLDEPVGYLQRTAMNVFRDRRRRLVLGLKLGLKRVLRPPTARDELEAVETRSVAADVLASLTPRQRAAIVLTEALDYSADEAGSILGIKGSTVRALTFQARSALKDHRETNDG
jgi:RNA polymerase sigma-70 factor (ECF subfamily)